jgi:hypothetical protein
MRDGKRNSMDSGDGIELPQNNVINLLTRYVSMKIL